MTTTSGKIRFNFLDNQPYKQKLESEWHYYRLVYLQGQQSNNSTLVDVALQRMRRMFNEIDAAGYTFTELNLPECFLYRSLLGF